MGPKSSSTAFLVALPHVYVCNFSFDNVFKLDKGRAKYDLRKYYFTNRVVNAWNSLPDQVVLYETINTFKSQLDTLWQHQDRIYDFQAELHVHGTGSWSLHSN